MASPVKINVSCPCCSSCRGLHMGPVSVVCICAYGLLSPMFFVVSETCLRLQLHYKQSVGLCLAFLCVCWKTAEGAFFFFFFLLPTFSLGSGHRMGPFITHPCIIPLVGSSKNIWRRWISGGAAKFKTISSYSDLNYAKYKALFWDSWWPIICLHLDAINPFNWMEFPLQFSSRK